MLSYNLKRNIQAGHYSDVVHDVKLFVSRYVKSAYNSARLFRCYGHSIPSPDKLISISPENINYVIKPPLFLDTTDLGVNILSGDWDKNRYENKIYYKDFRNSDSERAIINVENFDFYISFRNRFRFGKEWEDTLLFKRLLSTANKSSRSRYKSYDEIKDRLARVDRLYEYMKSNGYYTQRELINQTDSPFEPQFSPFNRHEVMVNIGRNGDLILEDGQHRFIIARLLGIKKIPVRVFVRHQEWQATREEIYKSDNPEKNQYYSHPDIKDLQKQ